MPATDKKHDYSICIKRYDGGARSHSASVLVALEDEEQSDMAANTPRNQILAIILCFFFLGLGGFFCALNFYISFLRYRLFCFRGRKAEYRYVTGAPVIGSALVVGFLFARPAFVSPLPRWALMAFIVLAVLDTGGLHCFIGTQAWYYAKKALQSRRQR